MDDEAARAALDRLIRDRRENYGALSRLIGRNSAYIQQYIKRGTPRRLDENDRRLLARYFGVDEAVLGGMPPALARAAVPRAQSGGIVTIPRLALGASAGAGSLDFDERAEGFFSVDGRWLKTLGVQPDTLSIIRVDGESMAPTLGDGDDIMVDGSDGANRLRDGIYVLRMDGVLMVKRVTLGPRRGQISVRSDNAHYAQWEDVDPRLVEIVGRVIWTGRRIG